MSDRSRSLLVVVFAAAVGIGVAQFWPVTKPTENRVSPKPSLGEPASGHQAGRRAPPRVVLVSPGPITHDPASPHYDPMRLMKLKNWSPQDILDNEPRDPAFAGPRENQLRKMLTAVMEGRFETAELVELTCKTSSCKLGLATGEPDLMRLYSYLQRFAWGNARQPAFTTIGDDGRGIASMVMVFDDTTRKSEGFEEWFEKTTAARRSFDDELWEQMFGRD